MDGLSIQKATAAVKAQINIRQKVLVVTKDKVIMSQHLKNTLLTLVNIAVSPELQEIYEIILNPISIVGCYFAQKW